MKDLAISPRIDSSSLLIWRPGQGIQFLDDFYLASIRPPDDPRADPNYLSDPPDVLLRYVAWAQPAHRRRAIHAKALHNAARANRDLVPRAGDFLAALMEDLRKRSLLPGAPDSLVHVETDDHGVEHWVWHGDAPRSGEPTVGAFGIPRVAVYRLLWPYERPGEPIPARQIPQRNLRLCPEDYFEPGRFRCVRPSHFFLSTGRRLPVHPLRLPNGTLSYRKPVTGFPSPIVTWFTDASDGLKRCTPRQHALSDHYQRMSNVPRTVYCAGCNRVRQEQIRHPLRRIEPTEQDRRDAAELISMLREANAKAEADQNLI